jgi:hypothetical protein
MKKIKILGTQLSKSEQKKFSGGLRDDGGGGSGAYCLHCVGWGGACGSYAISHWTRSTQPDPVAECAVVYSGCTGSNGTFTSGGCGTMPNY